MGFIRKALFIATGGLSGLVFKDNSKKERTKKAASKQVRTQKQTKSRRPTTRPARTSTVAKTVRSGNGTTNELERLADLHGRGALTDQEFAAAKAKIIGTSLTPNGSDAGPARFQAVEANVAAARDLADLAIHDRGAAATTGGSD
jgi:Short C-terminal domain